MAFKKLTKMMAVCAVGMCSAAAMAQPQDGERPRGDDPGVERPRDERPRDERPRDERPRDERPRDERPRDERPAGAEQERDRPRGERPPGDRGPEGRPQEGGRGGFGGGPPGEPGRGGFGGGRPGEGGRGGFGGFGGPGGPQNMMRVFPVMAALDKDGDGTISADEIENAVAALKSLDKNNDGAISAEEMRPNMETMRGGFGGRGEGGQSREGGFGRGGEGGPPGGFRGGDPEMVTRIMELDKNSDGKLTKDEVPERLQQLMARGDSDGDGALSRAEIESIFNAQQRDGARGGFGPGGRPDGPPEARRGEGERGGFGGQDIAAMLLERRDTDGDGKLSGDEIDERMRERGIDANDDGIITIEELNAVFRRMNEGPEGGRGGFGPGGRPGGPPEGGRGGFDRPREGEGGSRRPQRPEIEDPTA